MTVLHRSKGHFARSQEVHPKYSYQMRATMWIWILPVPYNISATFHSHRPIPHANEHKVSVQERYGPTRPTQLSGLHENET